MVEIRGITRSAFIARSAFAASALYGAGAVAPVVERALAAEPAGDTAILDFALTLESIEVAFTAAALKVKGLSGDVKRALKEIAEHEKAHQEQLKQTIEQLGATASPAPATSFPKLGGQAAVLSLGIQLEETGIGAYNGAAPMIESGDVLQAAGSIVQVEARHAGALRELAGQDPAPAAFDKALSRDEVMKRVAPYVKGGS
ncbi:MAG TPA: ferritin-like domain-containing protein [Thermoleophilaceae bacterium]|nr:ferritin-like domain-containing protein [Thermoleophilaceae bacterium]